MFPTKYNGDPMFFTEDKDIICLLKRRFLNKGVDEHDSLLKGLW